MKKYLVVFSLLVTAIAASAAFAEENPDEASARPLTVAVFGDWPYNKLLLDNAGLLINSVNADRDVQAVIHAGDIHAGSMSCTGAGVLPPISTSNPGWNQGVYSKFQQFN